MRPWIAGKGFDTRKDPSRHGGFKPFEFPPSRSGEYDTVLSHAAAGVRDPADPAPTRADGSPAQPATIISLSWGCADEVAALFQPQSY